MDLKHSSSISVVSDVFVTDCKSTDLITHHNSSTNGNQKEDYKVYKRRWGILLLFACYSASNAMQWIQYSIINNIITSYYNISDKWVDWTSMVYMILYIPLIFPGSWFLDKMGLRITSLVGITGTCIGSWIKVFSVHPDLFYISFIGQSVVAISQVFILSLPGKVAAVWFGPDQVSSACSVGVFGNQLGVALGFVLPPILVRNSNNKEEIGNDLQWMFNYVAGLTTVLVILMVLFFQDKPPTPPSLAQEPANEILNANNKSTSFYISLQNLISNRNYIFLLLSYGTNVGVFYAISTLLNPRNNFGGIWIFDDRNVDICLYS